MTSRRCKIEETYLPVCETYAFLFFTSPHERNWHLTLHTRSIIVINPRTVELHLSGRWLAGSPIIRFGLALRVNLSRIQQN